MGVVLGMPDTLRAAGRIALWAFAVLGVLSTAYVIYAALLPTHAAHVPTTRARFYVLMSALEFYHLDNTQYPTTEQGLRALYVRPTHPPLPANYPADAYLHDENLLLDQWGRRIAYDSSGGAYRLASLGADGARGGTGADSDLVELGGRD